MDLMNMVEGNRNFCFKVTESDCMIFFADTSVQMHADIFYIKTDVSKYITLYSNFTIIKYSNMIVALLNVSVDFLIKME